MNGRFVVTGSGRCGTKYMSRLLSAAGVSCGHEEAFNAAGPSQWRPGRRADSSWMATTFLPVDVPVVLLVRHPLAVVRSWVEIGFFGWDSGNPTHAPLRRFARDRAFDHNPYTFDSPADQALAMWLLLNETALRHAELVLRLETLDTDQLARLLRWAGADPITATSAFRRVGRTNRHERSRTRTGIRHEPTWEGHHHALATEGWRLAQLLGYDPEQVPDG